MRHGRRENRELGEGSVGRKGCETRQGVSRPAKMLRSETVRAKERSLQTRGDVLVRRDFVRTEGVRVPFNW